MAYVFECDPAKADANAGKHGVTFDEASTVFGDPLALLMLDPEHSVPSSGSRCSGCRANSGCAWQPLQSARRGPV